MNLNEVITKLESEIKELESELQEYKQQISQNKETITEITRLLDNIQEKLLQNKEILKENPLFSRLDKNLIEEYETLLEAMMSFKSHGKETFQHQINQCQLRINSIIKTIKEYLEAQQVMLTQKIKTVESNSHFIEITKEIEEKKEIIRKIKEILETKGIIPEDITAELLSHPKISKQDKLTIIKAIFNHNSQVPTKEETNNEELEIDEQQILQDPIPLVEEISSSEEKIITEQMVQDYIKKERNSEYIILREIDELIRTIDKMKDESTRNAEDLYTLYSKIKRKIEDYISSIREFLETGEEEYLEVAEDDFKELKESYAIIKTKINLPKKSSSLEKGRKFYRDIKTVKNVLILLTDEEKKTTYLEQDIATDRQLHEKGLLKRAIENLEKLILDPTTIVSSNHKVKGEKAKRKVRERKFRDYRILYSILCSTESITPYLTNESEVTPQRIQVIVIYGIVYGATDGNIKCDNVQTGLKRDEEHQDTLDKMKEILTTSLEGLDEKRKREVEKLIKELIERQISILGDLKTKAEEEDPTPQQTVIESNKGNGRK